MNDTKTGNLFYFFYQILLFGTFNKKCQYFVLIAGVDLSPAGDC